VIRAIDLGAGPVNLSVFEKTCVAERDFVVLYHWGMVQMLVNTPAGQVRRNEDNGIYQNAFAPNPAITESLAYRLSVLPGAPPQRHANHVLTDQHYVLAGNLFRLTYQFFAREFAHRDAFLGPLNARPPPPVAIAVLGPRLTQPGLDDAGAVGAAPIEPGTVEGFVLHPDYPEPDGGRPRRQTHNNHIHANVGETRLNQPDFER
jgi:hypothetical protein